MNSNKGTDQVHNLNVNPLSCLYGYFYIFPYFFYTHFNSFYYILKCYALSYTLYMSTGAWMTINISKIVTRTTVFNLLRLNWMNVNILISSSILEPFEIYGKYLLKESIRALPIQWNIIAVWIKCESNKK